MPEGRNHREWIPKLIRETAKAEVEERPVAAMAKIKEVSRDQRATIELLDDPGAQSSNVPVAVPFAANGAGVVLPITAGTKGIVVFLDHGVDDHLAEAETVDTTLGMDIEDAVFLPACFQTDADDVPDHDPGDWVWHHPNGNRIEIADGGDITIRDSEGARIHIENEPEEDTGPSEGMPERFSEGKQFSEEFANSDSERALFDTINRRAYPVGNSGETAPRMTHPDGTHVTLTHRGVALGKGEYGAEREVVSGKPNEPDRVELDGRHQHFHVVDHGDGEFSLAGPPLNFREFLAWMTDADRQASLRNADAYSEARTYAENYLSWLEDQTGRSIDPTNPDDWPQFEPMPTPEERDELDT